LSADGQRPKRAKTVQNRVKTDQNRYRVVLPLHCVIFTTGNNPTVGDLTHMARGPLWKRVERAREIINHQAPGIARSLIRAAKKGDTKAAIWLLEHTATKDDHGVEVRPIAPSSDRAVISGAGDGANAPRILIGVNLGADFAQLATSAAPGRTALPPAESPTPLTQPVSPDAPPRQIPNVIDAVPVLATHEEPEPRV
jgi:hypothetical protein